MNQVRKYSPHVALFAIDRAFAGRRTNKKRNQKKMQATKMNERLAERKEWISSYKKSTNNAGFAQIAVDIIAVSTPHPQ